MFLYGIGVQYGKHFVAGLTSRTVCGLTCWLRLPFSSRSALCCCPCMRLESG